MVLIIADDYLYFIPAITYSLILFASTATYVIKFQEQLIRHRRFGSKMPRRPKLFTPDLSRIGVIAFLIVLERIVYRYSYSFALGLELTVLKVLKWIIQIV